MAMMKRCSYVLRQVVSPSHVSRHISLVPQAYPVILHHLAFGTSKLDNVDAC
jgi:hypothetical protein